MAKSFLLSMAWPGNILPENGRIRRASKSHYPQSGLAAGVPRAGSAGQLRVNRALGSCAQSLGASGLLQTSTTNAILAICIFVELLPRT